MNSAEPEAPATLIPAFSKRQVMDWSLVLASQDIAATIIHSEEEGWALRVDPQERERAIEAIRQYRLENRTWGWKQPIPWSNATFDWGAIGWCVLLILVHLLTTERLFWFRDTAAFNTQQVLRGEWWRTFTAILLHADLHHLLANITTGFVLLGLAGARYGLALALFASYLAGAAGNVLGLVLYPHPYIGIGASGMVMGALGLIAIPPRDTWSAHPHALKQLLQAVFASVMLFVLLGVDPASDVIAHLGGFLAGLFFGLGLNALPERTLHNNSFRTALWLVLGTLAGVTAVLAGR